MATSLDDPDPCPFCGHLGCVMCPPPVDGDGDGDAGNVEDDVLRESP